MKLRYIFFIIIIINSILFTYFHFDKIKNEEIVNQNAYIFVKNNDSQKNIIKKLSSKKIDISYIDWRIISLYHPDQFSPKAGEYLIPDGSSIFEIQQILQAGSTITRKFTLIEGSTASDLKKNILSNKYS